MNKCFFIGRTTKPAELRYTQGRDPMAVASVSIAVDDGYGEKKTTSFFDLTIFGNRAESFEKYCPKGTKVAVECRARQNKWTDKNGQNRYSISFIVDNWEFAQGKGEATEEQTAKKAADEFVDIVAFDEDLPFS